MNSALSHVANVLSSAEYSNKEVLIIIPQIILQDEAAVEKVSNLSFNILMTSFCNL